MGTWQSDTVILKIGVKLVCQGVQVIMIIIVRRQQIVNYVDTMV